MDRHPRDFVGVFNNTKTAEIETRSGVRMEQGKGQKGHRKERKERKDRKDRKDKKDRIDRKYK